MLAVSNPSPSTAPGVVTVGHAIVDVLAHTDDAVVERLGLAKGTMTLVDDRRSESIYQAVAPVAAVSGGSAANTAVGLRSLGGAAAFVGKVRDDELGDVFVRDIRAAGVTFDVPQARGGPGTGRCVIMVTPDAEKTMCTSLGVGDLLEVADVDAALVAAAEIVYLEGYLCGLEHTDAAVAATIDAAESGGTTVALSLSDPLWVRLHGAEMAALLPRVGIVFANEQEACLLTGCDDVDDAVAELARRCPTVVVTRGAKGSIVSASIVSASTVSASTVSASTVSASNVSSGGADAVVAAWPVPEVVDTTGAGDMYAAGYLYGHCLGADIETSARIASLAAAEVLGHLGARPRADLHDLAAAAGLL